MKRLGLLALVFAAACSSTTNITNMTATDGGPEGPAGENAPIGSERDAAGQTADAEPEADASTPLADAEAGVDVDAGDDGSTVVDAGVDADAADPVTYTIGGTLDGPSLSIIIPTNGTDNAGGGTVPPSGKIAFVLEHPVPNGTTYDIAAIGVSGDLPAKNLTCTITNGVGQVQNKNVTNVYVKCR